MSRNSFHTIKDEVLRRIQSRQWPPGALIPSEVDLAAEFSCARATINRALRELGDTGLLERRRKSGTRVSLNPTRKATLDIPVIRLEIEGRGGVYRHAVLERVQTTAPTYLAAQMNLSVKDSVLHLRTLYLSDDRPYCYEDRWINTAAAPEILTAPLEAISANEWLVQNAPLTSGDITFLAENATAKDAAALNIPAGQAVFVVERLTHINDQSVTFVRLAYAPGYRMTTAL